MGGPRRSLKWRGGPTPAAPPFNPSESKDPGAVRRWERRVRMWTKRAQWWAPPNELALILYDAIGGDAALEIETIPEDEVDAYDGVERIVSVIRAAYGERDVVRKSSLLSKYESLHRYQGEGVRMARLISIKAAPGARWSLS